MTLQEMQKIATKFRDERDWKQFHSPKELAIQVVLEATELLELMQWKNGADLSAHLEQRKQDAADELADILHGVVLIADEMGIDLSRAFTEKMKKNERKYPIEKARGNSKKYTEYEK
jgi:NTP pyrophosphatase (non-canonical NTP hydrolase)